MLIYRHREQKGGDYMPIELELDMDDEPETQQEKSNK